MNKDSRSEGRLWEGSILLDPHRQRDKAKRVRRMFDQISPTYERVNRIVSAGRDRQWRTATVAMAQVQSTDRVLDLACGTGNLALAFYRAKPQRVVGVDFAHRMLVHVHSKGMDQIAACQADALQLPFCCGQFDIISCAFGIRNFQCLESGLREMHRVLAPGGRAMILEFAMPTHTVTRFAYQTYLQRILPRIANWISRDATGAYDYLPHSVMSFQSPGEIRELLLRVGFDRVEVRSRTCGIVQIFRADKITQTI